MADGDEDVDMMDIDELEDAPEQDAEDDQDQEEEEALIESEIYYEISDVVPRLAKSDIDSLKKIDQNKVPQTRQILTKYEHARIVGIRASQIARGAPTLIAEEEVTKLQNPILIAERELTLKRLPLMIKRRLPGKNPSIPRYEYFRY